LIINGLNEYVLHPIIPTPPADTEPHAHLNWTWNNKLGISFIRSALTETELCDLIKNKGAKACYNDLKKCTQHEGPVKQVSLLHEALATYCSLSKPLPVTAGKICNIVRRHTFDMGKINCDLYTCPILSIPRPR
ncbi:hypothetical protein L208DRAFT_1293272, partial [Tricholoma matsutake]